MEHLLRQIVNIFNSPSLNIYGKSVNDPTDFTPARARFNEKMKLIVDKTGKKVQSDAQILLRKEWDGLVSVGGRIDYNNTQYEIILVNSVQNEAHTQFIKLMLKKINVS